MPAVTTDQSPCAADANLVSMATEESASVWIETLLIIPSFGLHPTVAAIWTLETNILFYLLLAAIMYGEDDTVFNSVRSFYECRPDCLLT